MNRSARAADECCHVETLPADLRERLERCFSADLSDVRVRRDQSAAQQTAALGALAFCRGGHLFFSDGAYRPDSASGRWLIAHEVAHAIQQRGGTSTCERRPAVGVLEEEADMAANAFTAGELFPIRPRPNCPDSLMLLPLLVLVAAACGIAAIGGARVYFGSTSEMRRRQAQEGEFAYETAYGLIPIVGSYSQMMNGRTEADEFWGTTFFIMDLTMVGGVVRSAFGAFRPAASRALAAALKGAGTAAQHEALQKAQQQGFKVIAKEAAQKALNDAVQAGVKNGQRYTVVAVSEGWKNHSATYVYDNVLKKCFKLHGSVLTLAMENTGKEMAEKQFADAIASRANRLSIYALDEATGQRGLQWFNERAASGRLFNTLHFGLPPGCAGTQAMVLEKLGIGGAERLATAPTISRTFPILLDGARAMTTEGSHLAIGGWGKRAMVGTATQAGVALAGREVERALLDPAEGPRLIRSYDQLTSPRSGPVHVGMVGRASTLQDQLVLAEETDDFFEDPGPLPPLSHEAPKGVALLTGQGFQLSPVDQIPVEGGKHASEIDPAGDHYKLDPEFARRFGEWLAGGWSRDPFKGFAPPTPR